MRYSGIRNVEQAKHLPGDLIFERWIDTGPLLLSTLTSLFAGSLRKKQLQLQDTLKQTGALHSKSQQSSDNISYRKYTRHLPIRQLSRILFSLFFVFSLQSSVCSLQSSYGATDVYNQSFDSMTDGATVDTVDSWTVASGDAQKALVETGDTLTGSGKALDLIAASTPVKVERPETYGNSSPTWIETVTKPGLGADDRNVPTTGIAAVNFSSTGKIRVSNGTQWVDSGKTYDTDTWYRIQMKLNFSKHTYEVYISPASTVKTPFVADKDNLDFIDNTVSSLSRIGFAGSYQSHSTQNSLVDQVTVNRVDQLQIVTAPQTLTKGIVSGPITVELQTSGGEAQGAWTDLELELRSSTSGEFSLDKTDWAPITSVTIPKGEQQVTFYYKDSALGQPSEIRHT